MIWKKSGSDTEGGGTWGPVKLFENHELGVDCVCFSPDGKLLATGGANITLYSFDDGEAKLIRTLLPTNRSSPLGRNSWVITLSFSPDSSRLCSGSSDRSISIWNCGDGKVVQRIKEVHDHAVDSVEWASNGRVILSSSYDKKMKIWDAETFELKHTFKQNDVIR